MKIKKTNVALPAIHEMGRKIQQLSAETGLEYLFLQRGINSVVNIDLSEVVKNIDFNSKEIQTYPPSQGRAELREAINNEYFDGKTDISCISICGGGMPGIDNAFQIADVRKIYLPVYHWGNYHNAMKIRKIEYDEYDSFENLKKIIPELKDCAVLLGDPGNPFGNKYDDAEIFELIKKLDDNGTVVFYDSPYRRVFCGKADNFYQRLLEMDNLVILDSFSKSLGLSGQRLGFVHCKNAEFNHEMAVRLAFATNGTNAFAQILVEKLFTTEEGKKAVSDFKATTVAEITKNIKYLKESGLIANEFYNESVPTGIFAIINASEDKLLENRIGSVSLSKFTLSRKEEAAKYSRVCVSIEHKKLVEFFERMMDKK
ncbi:MAG: pyridoxal phosphate-dependent aminotransferase [Prevotellaceae bacterium]|jgi:aspartate/methionine/tyrosine aminotransferase|nr:pyridoxal phosphate-dependent aminotransferase [Prevotellaceae bacterium]